MALPTYLSLVNDVLVRMREPQVSTVSENTVSTLVGKYVNDAKRQVADAYDWDAFNQAINVSTVVGQSTGYSLTGAGVRFKTMDVINTTRYYQMTPITHTQYDSFYYTISSPITTMPMNYTYGRVDTNGDMKVNFWPVPDAVYNIRFSLVIPENDFESDSDVTYLAKEPIVLGALARALVERG